MKIYKDIACHYKWATRGLGATCSSQGSLASAINNFNLLYKLLGRYVLGAKCPPGGTKWIFRGRQTK